jgi:hypothetical protein
MKRKHEAKNDLFYAFVLFVMVVVVALNVAAEYFYRASEAYFSQADEASAPRTVEAVDHGNSSHALGVRAADSERHTTLSGSIFARWKLARLLRT